MSYWRRASQREDSGPIIVKLNSAMGVWLRAPSPLPFQRGGHDAHLKLRRCFRCDPGTGSFQTLLAVYFSVVKARKEIEIIKICICISCGKWQRGLGQRSLFFILSGNSCLHSCRLSLSRWRTPNDGFFSHESEGQRGCHWRPLFLLSQRINEVVVKSYWFKLNKAWKDLKRMSWPTNLPPYLLLLVSQKGMFTERCGFSGPTQFIRIPICPSKLLQPGFQCIPEHLDLTFQSQRTVYHHFLLICHCLHSD